jgi:hypothetical protein
VLSRKPFHVLTDAASQTGNVTKGVCDLSAMSLGGAELGWERGTTTGLIRQAETRHPPAVTNAGAGFGRILNLTELS